MKLTEYRRAAGLSQAGLACVAGVARASISHVETHRHPPSPVFAGKVCRALSAVLGTRINTWDVFPGHFSRICRNRSKPGGRA